MLELADAFTSEESEATGAYRVLTEALEAVSVGRATLALRQAYETADARMGGIWTRLRAMPLSAPTASMAQSRAVISSSRAAAWCARDAAR